MLEVLEYRNCGPEIVVVSGFGRRADWLLNLQAGSGADVMIGSWCFHAAWRLLDINEAVAVIQRYEQRNRVIAPIVRLVLSRLLGWRYHGFETERRRLVSQLPLVALAPGPTSATCGSS